MVYEFTATDDTKYFFGLHLVSSDDYRYVLNAHGDVIALDSKTGSTVAKYYEYDAFGNEINPDSSDTNPYRYCGEYYDFESDTIYLRARYYSPSHGRFTQVDTARDGLNWYAYCDNNPVNRIDPSGMIDYIYTSHEDYTVENIDQNEEIHYYVEFNGMRVEAASLETIKLYDWKRVDTDFLAVTLDALVNKANEKNTDIIRIFSESIGGELDFKLQLDNEALYLVNGVIYNSNEAGNFAWAYFLESVGFSGYLSGLLAQGGSFFPGAARMDGTQRLDEEWDRKARWAGVEYYYQRNNQTQTFDFWYKGKPQI